MVGASKWPRNLSVGRNQISAVQRVIFMRRSGIWRCIFSKDTVPKTIHVVLFTPRRLFLGIDVTVNLHGVPVAGHVRSNTVVSSMLQYTTLNTIQLYSASERVAVTDSATGLARFTKYETGNIV